MTTLSFWFIVMPCLRAKMFHGEDLFAQERESATARQVCRVGVAIGEVRRSLWSQNGGLKSLQVGSSLTEELISSYFFLANTHPSVPGSIEEVLRSRSVLLEPRVRSSECSIDSRSQRLGSKWTAISHDLLAK